MKNTQLHYINGKWKHITNAIEPKDLNPQLVLAFGATDLVGKPSIYEHIKAIFPSANIVSASTSGEILGDGLYDDTVVVTAIEFEKTKIQCVDTDFKSHTNSFEVGKYLMDKLLADDLTAVLVISDGSSINGSELVSGLNQNKPPQVSVTGGLAGDAARFQQTLVGLNETAADGKIVAIGFYGSNINIGHSSFGGWDEFGRERIVTKSDKNVLYELDNESALDLYKEYLGPYVDELPGSALLFPLSIRIGTDTTNLVRTILTINEAEKSMTFAGNLPVGSKVRLMKANFNKLIDASTLAAKEAMADVNNRAELALLISCVGRKLVLQERTVEEVEAAKNIFGNGTTITGFYSYGEISPFNPNTNCELHNQTMTITTFAETE
ncbi:FIST signal transduction protein [Parasediminibacterium sp. JCM 36343]|uniref:FIST signal transduction protein n=1 Tax=Parasediminibacterium sp. JCM 36343 TaxID=3374279 RepID=UPI00397BDE9C